MADRILVALTAERRFGQQPQGERLVGVLAQVVLEQELRFREALLAERIGGAAQRRFGGERPQPRNDEAGDASARGGEVMFDRRELSTILSLYGRMVAAGEWRDYASGAGREHAVFAVFRHTAEMPLYRIEKNPKLARKQGAYAVIAVTGLILKRGHELARVLQVLDKPVKLAVV